LRGILQLLSVQNVVDCAVSAFLEEGGMRENVPQQIHSKSDPARRWWIMPVILATWDAEIGRITVQS
jgi:hypothetical protein